MFWVVASFIVFLILWGFAWRSQVKLAFGILIGLIAGAAVAPFIGPYESILDVPLWLPPLPFAIVTLVLLVYGFLAWWVLDVQKKTD
ncbi:MAG: hypothetical protein OXF98_00050 [Rhodospirillaceae bacterium]|nr:hypothetical protein [Rhodospirillaceae bacterium]